MDFLVQTLVDYFGSHDISLGYIIKQGTDRFTVKGATDHTEKVTPKQVIGTYGLVGNDPLKALADTMSKIREVANSIDLDLLVDDLRTQETVPTLRSITEDYFGDTETLNLSAMARKLSEDTLRFKRNGCDFVLRTEEEIAEIQHLKELRAEKAAYRERTVQWLHDILASKEPSPVPEEQETLLKQLADFLLLGFNSEGLNLLTGLQSKVPVRELVIRILKKTNRFPEDADEFLLANGIHAGFSPHTLEEAESLTPFTPDSKRKDYSDRLIFSIDDEETRDIDDALSCTVDEDGCTHVGIYISDPASFVAKDTLLDQAAAERPLSMYLPTTTVPMFPEVVSYNFASLVQDELRPCLAFNVDYDEEGELSDWTITAAQVKITQRLTYQQADALMKESDEPVAKSLRALFKVARQLHRFRKEDGAVTLNRPELKIRVRGDEITVDRLDTDTPAHNLVSELMIQCNNLAARYALIHDIPIIYRAQDKPREEVTSVWEYEPCLFEQQVRKMKRTTLSTYPAPHFGLGLDLYTQVSSPLRRYADLVIQRQLSAHLRNLPLPYKQEELFTVLENADKTAFQNKALEREANTYWLLEYIRRYKMDEIFTATVVKMEGPLVLAELDGLCARGVVYTRDSVRTGERVKVKIREVHPDVARLVLELALN